MSNVAKRQMTDTELLAELTVLHRQRGNVHKRIAEVNEPGFDRLSTRGDAWVKELTAAYHKELDRISRQVAKVLDALDPRAPGLTPKHSTIFDDEVK